MRIPDPKLTVTRSPSNILMTNFRMGTKHMALDDFDGSVDRVFRNERELRDILGHPGPRVAAKVIDHVDDLARRFIETSPFVAMATRRADGGVDVTPRGDPPGFVAVLDKKTLAVPERPGNGRIDGLLNILSDPKVGLLFMIPGHNDTIRVSGSAKIVQDETLSERLTVRSHKPEVIILVTVERLLSHCPKAFVRSSLWRQGGWPDTSDVPSLAEIMVAHGRLADTIDEMQAVIDNDGKTRLY